MIQMKVFIIRVFLPSCWWVSCKLWIADKHDHPSQQPPGRAIPPSNGTFPLAYFFSYFPTMFFYRFNNQLSINEFPKKNSTKILKKIWRVVHRMRRKLGHRFPLRANILCRRFRSTMNQNIKKDNSHNTTMHQNIKTLPEAQRTHWLYNLNN